MKNKIIYILLLFIGLGCETEVVVTPPDYASKLVVNGLLNNEGEINVAVSFSVVAISTRQPGYLDDAIVEIWEDSVSLGIGVYEVFDKVYRWPVVPKAGSRYRIRVEHPGYPVVDETLFMPSANSFDGVTYLDSVGLDTSGQALSALLLRINDPIGEKNYYRVSFTYYNEITASFLPFSFLTSDPVLLNPSTVNEDDGSYVFDDALINGTSQEIRIEFSRGIATGTPQFMVLGESLSHDFYRYQVSLNQYGQNAAPFENEPVFIHTNIRGGLGIWAGKIAERDTVY